MFFWRATLNELQCKSVVNWQNSLEEGLSKFKCSRLVAY